MKTIKVRGKTWEGEWVDGHPVYLTEGNWSDGIIDGIQVYFDVNEDVDPDTVGEFTGRLDKNEKEIYEGDIVNGCSFNGSYAYGIVVFHKNIFVIHPIGKFIEGDCDIDYNLNHLEVIGNIFDNKDLLQ